MERSLEEMLQLAASAARAQGDMLFATLSQCAATALGATTVMITEIVGADRVRTLAVWNNGATASNYTYRVIDMPCETVIAGQNLHVESAITSKFAQPVKGYESFFGAPLKGTDGEVLGHVAVYHTAALTLSDPQRMVVDLVVGRAAAELGRLRAERAAREAAAQQRYLRDEVRRTHNHEEIIGSSAAMLIALDAMRRIAASDSPALISGEPGTGKELLARAIHAASRRAERPFIKLECGALPAALTDRELLGADRRVSALELANGGTLLLDDVGALPLESQVKLLRVLEERLLARPGAEGAEIDVRLIATTHIDLRAAVHRGNFAEDLLVLLSAESLTVPPLRDRTEDIPTLAQSFVRKHAARLGRRVHSVDPRSLAAMSQLPWRGNVRELEMLIESALLYSEQEVLEIPVAALTTTSGTGMTGRFPALVGIGDTSTLRAPDFVDELASTGMHDVQRQHILRVLDSTHWVIEGSSGAALKLGMKPATLRHRMKKLGIARATSARQDA